jgi:hypothetical protein
MVHIQKGTKLLPSFFFVFENLISELLSFSFKFSNQLNRVLCSVVRGLIMFVQLVAVLPEGWILIYGKNMGRNML